MKSVSLRPKAVVLTPMCEISQCTTAISHTIYPLLAADMNGIFKLPVAVVVVTMAAVVEVIKAGTVNAVVVIVTLPRLELCSAL